MEHQLNPATKAFLVTESKRYSTLHEDYRGTISLVEILLDRVDRFETFAFRGALVKRTMTHIVQLYDDQAEINSIPGYHVVLPKDLQRRIYTFARLLLFVGLPHLPGNGVEQLKKAFGLVTERYWDDSGRDDIDHIQITGRGDFLGSAAVVRFENEFGRVN